MLPVIIVPSISYYHNEEVIQLGNGGQDNCASYGIHLDSCSPVKAVAQERTCVVECRIKRSLKGVEAAARRSSKLSGSEAE